MEYDSSQTTIKMIKRFAEFNDKIVLEIGCGDGKISSIVSDSTQQYSGVDIDETAINCAIRTYKNVDFRIGSGEALEFADAQFDLVLFTLSLHHQNSELALRETDRVLKSDGNLLIIEPSIRGEFQQFFHLFDDETHEIQTAYKNLLKSSFTIGHEDSFNVNVIFQDQTDLCSYPFGREKIRSGDADLIIKKLNQLQPGSADHPPIRLKDAIDIYYLKKT